MFLQVFQLFLLESFDEAAPCATQDHMVNFHDIAALRTNQHVTAAPIVKL
jgi:hypothetical protein